MAKAEVKVAKRYAKALLELCAPAELEAVRDALNEFARLWSTDAHLRGALLNPAIPSTSRNAIVSDIADKIKPGHKTFCSFLLLLVQNARCNVLPEIARVFSNMIDELKKLLSLEITSAFEVPEGEKGELQKKIQSQYGAMASLDWKIDGSLLGGLLIRAGDKLLDSSVKGSLEKIRSRLAA